MVILIPIPYFRDHYIIANFQPRRATWYSPAMSATSRSIYNSPINRITPKQDDLLLFSSRLTHMVEPNTSDKPRHAIAFNTFVKGRLGNYRDVSELAL
jgi:hypothetical protein